MGGFLANCVRSVGGASCWSSTTVRRTRSASKRLRFCSVFAPGSHSCPAPCQASGSAFQHLRLPVFSRGEGVVGSRRGARNLHIVTRWWHRRHSRVVGFEGSRRIPKATSVDPPHTH